MAVTLRELLDAATPGPWRAIDTGNPYRWPVNTDKVNVCTGACRDARLIALAPEMAALLLDMADALRGYTERYPHQLEAEALLARLDRIGQ